MSFLGIVTGVSQAAERVDVHQRVQERFDFINNDQRKYGLLSSGNDPSQLLDLKDGETMEEITTGATVYGTINVKYKQYYKNIPIFNSFIVLAKNEHTGEIERDAYGQLIQKLSDDISSITPALSKAAALDLVLSREGDKDADSVIIDSKVDMYIYIDDDDSLAYLAYFIRYTSVRQKQVKLPTHMINANDGAKFFSFNTIKSFLVEGVGGNIKLGGYFFGKHPKLGKLDVVKTTDGMCHLKNDDIQVYHMQNGKTLSPTHKPFAYNCTVLIQDEINGGYSPLYDAFYFGTKVFEMFREWTNATAVKSRPVPVLVHFWRFYENAFWNGKFLALGDGGTRFYPFSAFDVIAHELAHGFTDDNSALIYNKMSGGINEAFSDITAEAFEFFLNFTYVDWKVNYYVHKAERPLRWMNTPSLDGQSIDNAAAYRDSLDVHHTSGVYNRAFYHLTNRPGWDIKMGFQVVVYASRIFWYPRLTFDEGACGMERAAAALGFNVSDVTAAFRVVGVSCKGPVTPKKQKLLLDSNYTNLSALSGNGLFYELDLTSANIAVVTISTFGGIGDVDIYVRKGRGWPSQTKLRQTRYTLWK